jgi:hypothetical protein
MHSIALTGNNPVRTGFRLPDAPFAICKQQTFFVTMMRINSFFVAQTRFLSQGA